MHLRAGAGFFWVSIYLFAGGLIVARGASEERWTRRNGETFESRLVEVQGPMAFFSKGRAAGSYPWGRLIDEDRVRVEAFAARQAASRGQDWGTTDGPFWNRLKARVFDDAGETKQPFVVDGRTEPDFYVIYFGAAWCGPCRDFVPRLNAWYHARRSVGLENFEVFYAGWDRSAKEQAGYIQSTGMPFPALRLSTDTRLRELRDIRPDSIPGLVVLDRDGNPLYHSHHGEVYRGPDVVLEELHQLLLWSNPDHPLARSQRFELTKEAVLAQQGDADHPPRLYQSTALPPEAFAGRDGDPLTFTLTISARGTVRKATTDAALPPEVLEATTEALLQWQFIPAIRDGAFVEVPVLVPLQPAD